MKGKIGVHRLFFNQPQSFFKNYNSELLTKGGNRFLTVFFTTFIVRVYRLQIISDATRNDCNLAIRLIKIRTVFHFWLHSILSQHLEKLNRDIRLRQFV